MDFNLDLETDAAGQMSQFMPTKISLRTIQKVLEMDTCVCKEDGLPAECNHLADCELKF